MVVLARKILSSRAEVGDEGEKKSKTRREEDDPIYGEETLGAPLSKFEGTDFAIRAHSINKTAQSVKRRRV